MSEGAKAESIEALRLFRAAMIKFAETANSAISGAESDVNSTLNWLESEQTSYWKHQLRVRQDAIGYAKEALRQKTLFRDASGRTPPAPEEEKAVRLAHMRLEEAEQKVINVRNNIRILKREMEAYKGLVQRTSTRMQVDIPAATSLLDQLATTLDAYVALAPADSLSPTQRIIETPPQ